MEGGRSKRRGEQKGLGNGMREGVGRETGASKQAGEG